MTWNDDLCQPCQKIVINIHRVFEEQLSHPWEERYPDEIYFGSLGIRSCIEHRSSCRFCQVLQLLRKTHFGPQETLIGNNDGSSDSERDDEEENEKREQFLWASPYLNFMEGYRFHSGTNPTSQFSMHSDFFVLNVSYFSEGEEDQLNSTFDWLQSSVDRIRSFTVLLDPTATQEMLYKPREVPLHFDSAIASEWLRACKEHHGETSCRSVSSPASEMLLINCTTREVCQYETTGAYAALSYVWGRVEQPPLTAGRVPLNTSAVIADAVTITLALGLNFIWIDQYCIDQNDDILRQRQINRMSEVYQQAEVTIVAASGSDATHGLPGVGNRPRKPFAKNRQFQSNQLQVMQISSPLDNPTVHSPWNSRGWTLQEAWLSRRLLCFTETQCYWECRGTCTSETVEYHEKVWDSRRGRDVQKSLQSGPRSRNPYTDLTTQTKRTTRYVQKWQALVGEFTVRQLTFDRDALAAVTGILSVIHRDFFTQEESQGSHEPTVALGLPFILGTYDDDPARMATLAAALSWRHPESERGSGHRWLVHRSYAQRRHLFPSWTWAGWKGRTEFDPNWASSRRLEEWDLSFIIRDVVFPETNLHDETSTTQALPHTAQLNTVKYDLIFPCATGAS